MQGTRFTAALRRAACALIAILAIGAVLGCTRIPRTGRDVDVVINYEPGEQLVFNNHPLRVAVRPFQEYRGDKNKEMGTRFFPIFILWRTQTFERADEFYRKDIISNRNKYMKKGLIDSGFNVQHMAWRRRIPELIAEDLAATGAFVDVQYTEEQNLARAGYNAVLTGQIVNTTERETSYVYGFGFLRFIPKLIPIVPWGAYRQNVRIDLTLTTLSEDPTQSGAVLWEGTLSESAGPRFETLIFHPWPNTSTYPFPWVDALVRRGMQEVKQQIVDACANQDDTFWANVPPYIYNGRTYIKRVDLPPFKGQPVRVAVQDIETAGHALGTSAQSLSEHMRAVLLHSQRFDVINREDMQHLRQEILFQDTGMIGDKIATEGRALGVEKIISSRLTALSDTYSFSIKLIDANSFRNEVIYSQQIRCGPDQLPEFIEQTVKRMILRYEGVE